MKMEIDDLASNVEVVTKHKVRNCKGMVFEAYVQTCFEVGRFVMDSDLH